MKIIKGDLIKLAKRGDFDVIVHGCNCFCTMGAGIASQIRKEFPEAYEADCQTVSGDIDKLGTFSNALIDPSGIVRFFVVNAYTQYYPGANADYGAIRKVFRCIKRSQLSTMRIGYPRIGAGIAGGDWENISKIIDEELEGCDHTLVEWDGGK